LLALSLLLTPLLAASCGGRVDDDQGQSKPPGADAQPDSKPTTTGDDAGDAGKDVKLPPGKDGGKDGGADAKHDAKDALPDYTDPGCPDAGPPTTNYECDPYAPNDCGDGKSCYPYVQYPQGPCEQEEYGATCIFAGTGGQGDPCGTGCQGGFVCVISGQGTQCIKMCDLNDPNPCKDGLVCASVDIPGIGGCI